MLKLAMFVKMCSYLSIFVFVTSNVDYSCLHQENWILNSDNHHNKKFNSATDVITASLNDYQFAVTSYGVPNYDRVFSQEDVDALDSRPLASIEFAGGKTSAVAGQFYAFGDDLGFVKYSGPSAKSPTNVPTNGPSLKPTSGARYFPTNIPVLEKPHLPLYTDPTSTPTRQPSSQPSDQPTGHPTRQPTSSPTGTPTATPSDESGSKYIQSYFSCEGYWPPNENPSCPSLRVADITDHFNLFPAKEIGMSSPIGMLPADHRIGRAVNGIEFRTWNISFMQIEGTDWRPLSPEVESLNMDICRGLVDSKVYYHNAYPSCLADKLQDYGFSHSPLYGFAFDGFPIYGPYQAKGQLARSCWQKRDYQSKETGCGTGKRSCRLIDEFDYSKGIREETHAYPHFDIQLKTSSGKHMTDARNGIFYEDYFFNSTCASLDGPHLNEYNGHDHDGLGFHYHMTLNEEQQPAFPYIIGPRYYGCVLSRQNSRCDKSHSVKPWESRCLMTDDQVSSGITTDPKLQPTKALSFPSLSAIIIAGSLAAAFILVGFSCGLFMKHMLPASSKMIAVPTEEEDSVDHMPGSDCDRLPMNVEVELVPMELHVFADASRVYDQAASELDSESCSNTSMKSSAKEFMAAASMETARLLDEKAGIVEEEIDLESLVVAIEINDLPTATSRRQVIS
jgi:hypothetical protein